VLLPDAAHELPATHQQVTTAEMHQGTAEQIIGAPTGARNRVTNTKSLPAASGTAARSSRYLRGQPGYGSNLSRLVVVPGQ
jgi:hypothetical protein